MSNNKRQQQNTDRSVEPATAHCKDADYTRHKHDYWLMTCSTMVACKWIDEGKVLLYVGHSPALNL